MTSQFSAFMAQEHIADLRREAARERLGASTVGARESGEGSSLPVFALRIAGSDEQRDVRRLADLDDAPVLEGRILLALLDGKAIAAISLDDGRVVANPFVPTAAAVELLRLRAGQLEGSRGRRRLRTLLRPRTA